MKIPRFRITPEQAAQEKFALDEKESRHARSVLRLKAGDAVQLFDGAGRNFAGVVLGDEGGRVSILVSKSEAAPAALPFPLTLAAAVVKPEAMEWAVEKSCELGASRIVPLLTERVVVRLSADRWAGKLARWRKIAAESCKQCGQSRLPEIVAPTALDAFLRAEERGSLLLLPTLAAPGEDLSLALDHERPRATAVLIGPEGDFTRAEADAALAAGARPVSLGALVLRSETASLYALSVVSAWLRKPR